MVIEFRPRFEKELRKTPKDIQNRVRVIVETLAKSENLETSGVDYKTMEGQKDKGSYFQIRVAGWRIGIKYAYPNILIITILSRGDIYKHFPPK